MSNDQINDSDDSLASSFVSSFSLPPPSPKPPKEKNAEAGLTDIHLDQPTLIIPAEQNQNKDAPDPVQSSHKGDQSGDPSDVENPVETAKNESSQKVEQDWKSVLDQNLEVWRGESSQARQKSESTRLRLEEERVKFDKEQQQKKKDEEKKKKQDEEDVEVERKLKELLNAPASASSSGSKAGQKRHNSNVKQDKERKRWNAVRDAWEIVRDGSSVTVPDDEVDADARDLTAGDAGGLAEPGHRQGAEVLKEAHETITKISQGDGNLDPTPASAQRRNDLLSAESEDAGNRRQAVGTSWKDASEVIAAEKGATQPGAPEQSKGVASQPKSAPTPGATGAAPKNAQTSSSTPSASSAGNALASSSSTSLTKKSSNNEKSDDKEDKVEIGPIPTPSPLSGPPYQPPSLTLSLFTSPSHRSIARIAAVVGINLILPFINGVMLGFGEIFARETVIFGRRWWRGEATLRSLWRPSAGGNLAGLGLGLDSFGETV